MPADQFIMAQIALWGPAIYMGLGAAALSSALGSILVAPRTLQALARDNVLPVPKLNRLLEKGWGRAQEPVPATCVSSVIAIAFVAVGDIDFIAHILSMFFMVTYGALCSVSFLEYFAGNPSYRPTFHSRWYLSLLGAVMCGLMMIYMNALYSFVAISLMVATYFGLRRSRRGRARPDGDLTRDDVPTDSSSADLTAEEPRGEIGRGLAALDCRGDPLWRTPIGALRPAALDQPSAWVWALHSVLSGRILVH